jgi:hypothetical protein
VQVRKSATVSLILDLSQGQLVLFLSARGSSRPLDRPLHVGSVRFSCSPSLARCESTATDDKTPSFRDNPELGIVREAFAKRRCLIPADGFYEWRKTARPKLPFAIAMKDGRPFTFAGLWEGWKDPESEEWLRTCTIITGEPNELVAQIHPRMPVILPEQHHAAWLGETDDGNLKELLVPYPADQMRMWEISPPEIGLKGSAV